MKQLASAAKNESKLVSHYYLISNAFIMHKKGNKLLNGHPVIHTQTYPFTLSYMWIVLVCLDFIQLLCFIEVPLLKFVALNSFSME